MTVSTTNTKHIYAGTGLSTNFDFDFPITDAAQIKVYLTNPAGVVSLLETGYNVNIDAGRVEYPYTTEVDENGDPVPVTPLPEDWKLTILRVVDLTQEVDLRNQGAFNSEVLEQAYDKATMILQQQQEVLSRCVKYPVDQNPTSTETEQFLSDVNASKSAAQTAATAAATAQTGAESAKTSAETASTAAQAAKTAAETAATSAASSASSASTSATAAAGSATAAAGSATTAGTKATEAASSASAAASSASAAASSATAAGTSASSAATSASTATTKAAEAAATAAAVSDEFSGVQAQLNSKVNTTDIITISQGGTGAESRQSAINALIGSTTFGYYLRGNSTDAVMSAIQANDLPVFTGSGAGGTRGAVPAPTAADATAGKFLRADGTWATVSGGGGGGSLQWVEGENAPLSSVVNGIQTYQFAPAQTTSQALHALIRVPTSYKVGTPIKIKLPWYCASSSGGVAICAQAILMVFGASTIDGMTALYSYTPTATPMNGGNATAILETTADLTDSMGHIGIYQVQPGNLIHAMVYRSSSDGAPDAANLLPYGAEVILS